MLGHVRAVEWDEDRSDEWYEEMVHYLEGLEVLHPSHLEGFQVTDLPEPRPTGKHLRFLRKLFAQPVRGGEQQMGPTGTAATRPVVPERPRRPSAGTPVLGVVDLLSERVAGKRDSGQCEDLLFQGGKRLRPAAAARALSVGVARGLQMDDFVTQAYVDRILGSAPHSLRSYLSGLRAWAAFATGVLRTEGLPPSVAGLVAFSLLFSNVGTFKNYLCAIKLACDLVGCDHSATGHTAVKRAATAIKKQQGQPRHFRAIGRRLLRKLCALSRAEGDLVDSMLYLTSYTFLLRVPSEGLPLRSHKVNDACTHDHGISANSEEVSVTLRRRKNMPHGSRLTRRCTCRSCSETCPVHVLGPWLQGLPSGTKLFEGVTAPAALRRLRQRLLRLGTTDAAAYRLHDFRRGHAQDLVHSGSRLGEILAAGQWRSAAFVLYLDQQVLDTGAVVEAHMNMSSDEEGEPEDARQLD